MPTSTILPNGTGTYNVGTATGAATNWQCLVSDDADTSYVRQGSGTNTCAPAMANPVDVTAAGSIVSVKAFHKSRYESGTNAAPSIYLPATGLWIGAYVALTNSYALYSEVLTSRPVSGDPWRIEDIAAIECGYTCTGANYRRTTYSYAEVNWVEASGFFSCLVASLLGAFVGLGAQDVIGLANKLGSLRGWRLAPEEYRRFWDDLKASRYPRHFVIAR